MAEEVTLRIRQAQVSDLGSVLALEERSFGEPYPRLVLRQFLDLAGPFALVAESEQPTRLLGYAMACRSHDVRLAWFLSAATDPSARREGVAAALSAALFDRLYKAGVEGVRMTTSPKNEPVLALARRMHARVIETVQDYFGPGEERVLLELSLPHSEEARAGGDATHPSDEN